MLLHVIVSYKDMIPLIPQNKCNGCEKLLIYVINLLVKPEGFAFISLEEPQETFSHRRPRAPPDLMRAHLFTLREMTRYRENIRPVILINTPPLIWGQMLEEVSFQPHPMSIRLSRVLNLNSVTQLAGWRAYWPTSSKTDAFI